MPATDKREREVEYAGRDFRLRCGSGTGERGQGRKIGW